MAKAITTKEEWEIVKENTYQPVDIHLRAMETPRHEGYIFGATYQDSPCGCRVEGCGTLQNPLRIAHCEKHKT